MQIWVDADACPGIIKDIIYRAAMRCQIMTTLVANQRLTVPISPYLRAIQVAQGLDVADHTILAQVAAGELVITADIPLAAEVIASGAHALNPRGEWYSSDNIRERLAVRDWLAGLRASGVHTGGPSPMDQSDCHAFARQLDQWLARISRAHRMSS